MKENHTLNKTTNNQVHRILVLLLPSNNYMYEVVCRGKIKICQDT